MREKGKWGVEGWGRGGNRQSHRQVNAHACVKTTLEQTTLQFLPERRLGEDEGSSTASSQQLLPLDGGPAQQKRIGSSMQSTSSDGAFSIIDELEEMCSVRLLNSSLQVQVLKRSQQVGLMNDSLALKFIELMDLANDCTMPLNTFNHHLERLCAQMLKDEHIMLFGTLTSMKLLRQGEIELADAALDRLQVACKSCDYSSALDCVWRTSKATHARLRAFLAWHAKDEAGFKGHLAEMGEHLQVAMNILSSTELDPLISGRCLFQWSRYRDAHETFQLFSTNKERQVIIAESKDAMEMAMVAFHDAGSVAISQYVLATSDMCRLMGKTVEVCGSDDGSCFSAVRTIRQLQQRCIGLATGGIPVGIAARVLMDSMGLELRVPSDLQNLQGLDVDQNLLREMRPQLPPQLHGEADKLINGGVLRW